MLEIYTYSSCDTCRRATRWLKARKLAFVEKPIRETPPEPAQIRAMLKAYDGDRRKVFNTAGRDYRERKLGETVDTMTDAEVVALLSGNGNLVKRPFVIGKGVHLVGFGEVAWSAGFGA